MKSSLLSALVFGAVVWPAEGYIADQRRRDGNGHQGRRHKVGAVGRWFRNINPVHKSDDPGDVSRDTRARQSARAKTLALV